MAAPRPRPSGDKPADADPAEWLESAEAGEGPDPVRTFGRSRAEQDVLAALRRAREARDSAESDLVAAVAAARKADLSWTAIGPVLGMTRQGAHSYFAHRLRSNSR